MPCHVFTPDSVFTLTWFPSYSGYCDQCPWQCSALSSLGVTTTDVQTITVSVVNANSFTLIRTPSLSPTPSGSQTSISSQIPSSVATSVAITTSPTDQSVTIVSSPPIVSTPHPTTPSAPSASSSLDTSSGGSSTSGDSAGTSPTLTDTSSRVLPATSSIYDGDGSTVASFTPASDLSGVSPGASSSHTSAPTSPTSAVVRTSSSKSKAGPIAGGVIGGLLGLLLLLGLVVLWRRRRRLRQHVAPSAEFMRAAGHPSGFDRSASSAQLPLARQTSLLGSDPPPPFAPGLYVDPVYEKVRLAATQRQQYENDHDDVASATSWPEEKAESSLLID